MSKIYLLDTNAAADLMNGVRAVEEVVNDADEILLSIITVGELYFGVEKSTRIDSNRARVDALVARYPILYADLETAREYSRVVNELRQKGRPIPQNDAWIAATARQYKLTLLTRDRHFNDVDGLSVASW